MTAQEIQTAILETQKLIEWNHKHSTDWPYVNKVKDQMVALLALQLKLAKENTND